MKKRITKKEPYGRIIRTIVNSKGQLKAYHATKGWRKVGGSGLL